MMQILPGIYGATKFPLRTRQPGGGIAAADKTVSLTATARLLLRVIMVLQRLFRELQSETFIRQA